MKPLVAVLTDGSGHHGASRLELSRRLMESAGARVSAVYGVVSDREMYRAILEQDLALFLGLADQLAGLLVEQAIDSVAADALEGYNPTHDVCRLVIDRAVRIAEQRSSKCIKNYAFPLTGRACPSEMPADAWRIKLTSDQLAWKLAESRRYAEAAGGELPGELDKLLDDCGEAAFSQEVLSPMDTTAALARCQSEQPFYEVHGEKRVAAGQYCATSFTSASMSHPSPPPWSSRHEYPAIRLAHPVHQQHVVDPLRHGALRAGRGGSVAASRTSADGLQHGAG